MASSSPEKRYIELDGVSLHYCVHRHSRRSKRLALRVSPSGDVEVRVPPHTPQREIDQLLKRHSQWLWRCMAKAVSPPALPQYRSGDYFFYLGDSWQLRVDAGRGAVSDLSLRVLTLRTVDHGAENIRRLMLKWLRERSLEYFSARLVALSKALPWPQPVPTLRVRAMRSRWGSCSKRGICLNTRLMKAPPACIDMVIVHELCHLVHMNHSPAFYALMDDAMPDWREASRQLDSMSTQLLLD